MAVSSDSTKVHIFCINLFEEEKKELISNGDSLLQTENAPGKIIFIRMLITFFVSEF